MRKPTKKRLFLFSIITIVLVLLVLEVIFRIIFALEYRGYHTSVYVQGNSLQKSDSLLVFKNRPFYLDYYKRYQFNEEGFRVQAGDVFMPEKGPDDYWVFLFGGSAMEGTGSNKDGEWLDITGVEDHAPDRTIAGFLQAFLQMQMKGKKVTVFNAANSGYSILQSMRRYEELSAKYQMDYVVSMDGENEPAKLAPGQSVDEYIRARWNDSKLFKFPLSVIVPMTSHSAFVNKMKQASFHFRHHRRMERNVENNFPAKDKWHRSAAQPLKYADDRTVGSAVDSFYAQLRAFDSLLTSRKQRHTLIIQPHLSLKDTARMMGWELALYKYFTVQYNDPLDNSFKKKVYEEFQKRNLNRDNVWLLNWYYKVPVQAFVDYCHFTEGANDNIATMLGFAILKDIQR